MRWCTCRIVSTSGPAAFGYVMTLPRLPDLIPQGVLMLITFEPPFTMWLPQFVG